MRKIHYKDDFKFWVRLLDGRGEELGVPEWDWELRVRTTRLYGRCFVASRRDGVMVNCYADGGRICVVCDDHGLEPGVVSVEFCAEVPEGMFPDGSRLTVVPETAEIELTREKGELPCGVEVDVVLPTIKGEPFTYDDFTPEQIEGLREPAVAAAVEAMAAAGRAESGAAAAGKAAEAAERATGSMLEVEVAVVDAESARERAESLRERAETERVKAEQERATEFASWETELDNKADRSELSNILGTPAEEEIEEIEPGIVTEALRKVPQVLTPEEQAQVRENIGVSKMELFIDIYNAAFKVGVNVHGKYDPKNAPDATHVFRAYDLWLTYEEAIEVVIAGRPYNNNDTSKFYTRKPIRTNLPFLISPLSGFSEFAFVNDTAEVFRLSDGNNNITGPYAFYRCAKLHTIIGRIKAEIGHTFGICPKLANVEVIIKTGITLYLDGCPLLSLESFRYMIDNSESCSLIVHPDVYAKLTDESNTEWHQVLLDAAEKNINFATV